MLAIGTNFKIGPASSLGLLKEWAPLMNGQTSLETLEFAPILSPRPTCRAQANFLDFFVRTLDFAVFPHRSCQPLTAPATLDGAKKAWEGIREQARGRASNPEWCHKDIAG